jgi:hypothetical protein
MTPEYYGIAYQMENKSTIVRDAISSGIQYDFITAELKLIYGLKFPKTLA